ncbi:DUF4920 domain-containing protein [Nonlabens ponticola]|uniref:DUF4920 domain-containing protein n=1 Tax=Nonlabens ponticola TaxID=2496866 RepID=A0A3S9MZ54_9FLAO|nr:DUF4920 domain-containing protein [Nonlabens ponticola]AZQ44535.1 DUF4920 domain-containing protein [Nonlabens ponticola]
MKYFITLFIVAIAITSCRNESEQEEMPAVNDEQVEEVAYLSYGDEIDDETVMTSAELMDVYELLKPADTVQVKVKTIVNEVCAKKGCWIKIPLENGQEARVTFKDYGFFLPRDSQGKEVVLNGKIYKSITPMEDLKHYAMDAKKSQEEIDAITEDEVTLAFEADGALVESYENPDVFTPETQTAE